MSMKPRHLIEAAYDLTTGDEDARVCKDIPQQACQHQPRNAIAYMLANLINKIADELTSAPALVIIVAWRIGGVQRFFGSDSRSRCITAAAHDSAVTGSQSLDR